MPQNGPTPPPGRAADADGERDRIRALIGGDEGRYRALRADVDEAIAEARAATAALGRARGYRVALDAEIVRLSRDMDEVAGRLRLGRPRAGRPLLHRAVRRLAG